MTTALLDRLIPTATSLRSATTAGTLKPEPERPRNAGPRRLRQLESYAATGLLTRSPEGSLLGAERGAPFNAD